MFKNLSYITAQGLDFDALENMRFKPCEPLELQSVGFVAPYGEEYDLVRKTLSGSLFFALCIETKNIPKQVIDRLVREKSQEVKALQGFTPGRKQVREIRDQVIDDLLPKAFASRKVVRCWYDPADKRLAIDTVSTGQFDQVLRALFKTVEGLQLDSVRTAVTPATAMTQWLRDDEAPAGFTVDDMAHLERPTEGKAAARFVNHVIDADLVRPHLADGKVCRRLAMTWADRISFVLHDHGGLSGITPLDILKEREDDEDRVEADLSLMACEFRKLIVDLEQALGGRLIQEQK